MQHAFRLVPGFFELTLGIGIGDDAAADGNLPPAAGRRNRADEDVGVHLIANADVTERAAVGAADGGFQFGDDLHGADFGDAGDGAAGERVSQEVERAHVVTQCAFDDGDEVLHPGVLFEGAELCDADAAGLARAG